MSLKKTLNSFKYAIEGINKVYKEEHNFRSHIFSSIVVLFFSIFIFNFDYIEICITLICIVLVLITEIINTVIENSWDHLEPNHHHVVKSVKDMMAGVVMLTAIFSSIVWIILILN